MKIFIDDWRTLEDTRHSDMDGWTIVRDVNGFKEQLEIAVKNNTDIDEVSFDYDLGSYTQNGISCAKMLLRYVMENDIDMPKCYVHSGYPNIYPKFELVLKLQYLRKTKKEMTLVNLPS